MKFPRSSGILLHPTSLPSRFGIGDLGPEAFAFAGFLFASGQQVWQVLPLGPTFRLHNFPREVVAYTGTHDNDTTIGWWTMKGAGDSTRSEEDVEKEHTFTQEYLSTDGKEMNWVFIHTLMASVADMILISMQDVLGEERLPA